MLSAVVYYASRFNESGRSVKVGYPPAHKRVESAPYGAFGKKRCSPSASFFVQKNYTGDLKSRPRVYIVYFFGLISDKLEQSVGKLSRVVNVKPRDKLSLLVQTIYDFAELFLVVDVFF